MKRILPVLIIILCIAGSTFYYYSFRQKSAVHPSSFLPEEVVVYLNQKDLGFLLQDIRDTPLAAALHSIDFPRLALDVGFSLEAVNTIREIREYIDSEDAATLIDIVFKKNFTIALLPDPGTAAFVEYLRRNFIMFFEPSHGTAMLELIGNLMRDDLKITSSQYGTYVIYRLPLDNSTTVSLVAAHNLMVAALDERTLRRAIDRFDEKRPNLKENFFYNTLSQKYKATNLFCFFSVNKIRKQLQLMLTPQSPALKILVGHLEDWKGFTSGAYGSTWKKDRIKDEITLHFNQNDLNRRASHFLKTRPQKNKRISYAPKNTLFYYWTNTFDISTMWDLYVSESGLDEKTITEMEKSIASLTDITFAELLNLPGNNVHLIVEKPSPVDFVPVPNFTIILQMKNSAQAAATLRHFVEKNEIPHQTAIYRDVPMTYWGMQRQKGLQPVYAVYDGVLFFSSSVKTQMGVIDTIMDGNGITTSQEFQDFADFLLLQNNSTVFIQSAKLLGNAREIVKWGGTMIALKNRKTAYTSKRIIEDLALPLIEGLKMYSTIATRSYIENGKIIIESNIIRTPKQED